MRAEAVANGGDKGSADPEERHLLGLAYMHRTAEAVVNRVNELSALAHRVLAGETDLTEQPGIWQLSPLQLALARVYEACGDHLDEVWPTKTRHRWWIRDVQGSA